MHWPTLTKLTDSSEFSPLQMGKDTLLGVGVDGELCPCLASWDVSASLLTTRPRVVLFPFLAINETILMVRTTKDLSLSFVCLGNVTTDLGRVDAEAGCCARVYLCVAVERVWWVLQV